MIRNIVFDIGNVLVDFSWREHIAGCGFEGETAKRLGQAMMEHPVWNEIDRGVWSNEELLQAFIRNAPDLEQEIRVVFANLNTVVRLREGSCAWVRDLRQRGFRVYYLSNFSRRVRSEAAEKLSFLKEMDGGVMSCDVHLIKPDPAIFRVLFEKYDLNPEECVFLDDSVANVQTAESLGMAVVQVESQEQAKEELERVIESRR